MTHLSENWITERHIDFEYKKYLLLGWLQKVEAEFQTIQLYPIMAELLTHYRNAFQLRQNKQYLEGKFPRQLKGLDSSGLSLEFESLLQSEGHMDEIEKILDFSIPKFEEWLKEGKVIYDFIDSTIVLSPVGIVPLRTDEGYLILSQGVQDLKVYSFQITIYDQPDAKWRAMRTSHIADWTRSVTNTPESIKLELIRNITSLPNPAVYFAASAKEIPLEPTFLPIAKRALMRKIAQG